MNPLKEAAEIGKLLNDVVTIQNNIKSGIIMGKPALDEAKKVGSMLSDVVDRQSLIKIFQAQTTTTDPIKLNTVKKDADDLFKNTIDKYNKLTDELYNKINGMSDAEINAIGKNDIFKKIKDDPDMTNTNLKDKLKNIV